ncbi:hypothetical protein BKA58DRAFT_380746 [Alternaria rosae]|uniref:uncharacterized protein n=1 Tax=Alternaria rosae TaxID=1187941 RepID=UPI001E8D21B0|nr:uncharacterized protein BKA58DRAFT_380746 [Alternaria rosae]KAH6875949.1 hypothetical protein BKA58DRAFT_380746 [Alternaria rosae]
MKDSLPSNRITLEVHNNIPWRYLYIPGLYAILLGGLTFSHSFDYWTMDPYPGKAIGCSNILAGALGTFLVYTGIGACMGWYFFRDTYFRRAVEVDSATMDISGMISEENFWRNIIQRYPWRHAHKLGSSLVILALFIIAYGTSTHRMNPESTDWTTVLPIRFGIMLAIILKLAGLVLCIGWHIFKDIETGDTEDQKESGPHRTYNVSTLDSPNVTTFANPSNHPYLSAVPPTICSGCTFYSAFTASGVITPGRPIAVRPFLSLAIATFLNFSLVVVEFMGNYRCRMAIMQERMTEMDMRSGIGGDRFRKTGERTEYSRTT